MFDLTVNAITGLGIFWICTNLEKLQNEMKTNRELKKILDNCRFYPKVNGSRDQEKDIDF